jgi:hypothetical protein
VIINLIDNEVVADRVIIVDVAARALARSARPLVVEDLVAQRLEDHRDLGTSESEARTSASRPVDKRRLGEMQHDSVRTAEGKTMNACLHTGATAPICST